MTKIAVPISAQTSDDARKQMDLAVKEGADILEVRFDYQKNCSHSNLLKLLKHNDVPKILTIRHMYEAGPDPNAGWRGSEPERIILYCAGLQEGVEYFDLEGTCDSGNLMIEKHRQGSKKISSWHNFKETPLDLDVTIEAIRARAKPDYVKVATMANYEVETECMLDLMASEDKFLGMTMGPYAAATRYSAPLHDQDIVYACITKEQANAPGQVCIADLRRHWDCMGWK